MRANESTLSPFPETGATESVIFIPAMAKKAQQVAPRTFEEALAELEKILADIESGKVGLEESLAKYERGNFLIQHCRGVLEKAEKQIEVLSKSSDGNLVAEALDEGGGDESKEDDDESAE
jgi:exodeoxyribonuclease VII small subunit